MAFWTKKSSEDSDSSSSKTLAGEVRPESETPQPVVVTSATPAILGSNDTVRPASSPPPPADPSKVRCALGAGTFINGKLSFDTSVQIDGKMKGELYSSKALIVGSGGLVEGEIDVGNLVIFGTVRGTIKVAEKVELKAGAILDGELYSPCIVMEEGAVFNGTLMMGLVPSSIEDKPGFSKPPVASTRADNKRREEGAHASSSMPAGPVASKPQDSKAKESLAKEVVATIQ